MLRALELLGVVKNAEAIKALDFAAAQSSAVLPATLSSFALTLKNLIKLNPDHKRSDYAKLEGYIHHITSSGTDLPLTYTALLELVDALPKDPLTPHPPEHH